MEFLDLVRRRRSCRAFLQEQVAEEKLNYILQAARLAPSACNLQPLRLHVLSGERLEQVRPCAWLYNAPLAVMVCSLDALAWKRKYDGENFALADAAIAVDHMALAAAEQGVDSCIIGAIKVTALQQALQLPEEEHIQLILALGYADPAVPDKVQLHDKRRSADELFVFEGD